MKTQSIVLSLFALFFLSISAFSQSAKTENIKVWGNCGMCKKTIETAAKEAGASEATWNTETKVLAVSYNASSNNQKIQKAVAAAGYDTQEFTAPEAAYNNLHECCKYDRKATAPKNHSAAAHADKCCDEKECHKDGKGAMAGECCKDGKCAHHEMGDKGSKGSKGAKGSKGSKDMECCQDVKACTEKGCCKA